MNNLILVRQLPIIEEQLKSISAEIDEKVALAESLVCSEDSVKEIKKIRAEFNKSFEELEEQRKAVKTAIMTPYTDFEAVYRQYVSDKYNAADATLKTKIGRVEEELKARKMKQVREYFNEYALSCHVEDYADFDRQMAGLRASYSMPEFKRICHARIDPLASGLKAIDAQPEELRAEILAEFRKSLSATEAMRVVSERRKAVEEQERRSKEREALQAAEDAAVAKVETAMPAPLTPPKEAAEENKDDDPLLTVRFAVTAKRSRLIELKKYLDDGGYQYE